VELDEFPGTVFRCTGEKLTAIDADGERTLIPPAYFRMFFNVFLADINGDGLPEFCATGNGGSGINWWQIVVYDYAAGKQYELIDRHYEYTLSMKDGQLLATQAEAFTHTLVKMGSLAIIDDGLAIVGPGREGVNVTGAVKSYNPGNPTTVYLYNDSIKYTAWIGAAGGSGQTEGAFAFEGIAPGTYTLVVNKAGHLNFTLQDIVVGDEDVDLTQDNRPEVRLIALRCGDINGDGMINDGDLTALWMTTNYNKRADQAANPLCDLNGDGMINDGDLTILWMTTNYNKGEVIVP
jgi:hypothetical protein